MRLLHTSIVAKKILQVKSARTVHNRYKDAIIYVQARGRGGRAAYLPTDLFHKKFEKYAEDIDESLILSQTNIENISNQMVKIKQKVKQSGGNSGGNAFFYLDSKKTITCIDNYYFVDADKGAALCGYKTAKDWRKTAARNEYEFVEIPVQGGFKKYYLIEALPPDARARFSMELKRYKDQQAEDNEKACGVYNLATDKDKLVADTRVHIITEWIAFRSTGKGKKTDLDSAFEIQWNLEHPDNAISIKSLHRWKKGFDERGIDALVPHYSRDPKRVAEFHPKAKALIQHLWLDERKPRAYSVYMNAKAICDAKGWAVPSYSTVDRFLKAIPADTVARLRHGHKAFEEMFACIMRDIDSIKPGQVYVGDGRMLDVSFGDGKKGKRVVIFPWLDVRTKRFLSCAYSNNMNDSGAVTAGYYMAAREHMPQDVIVDHGNDYLTLSYSRKIERELPTELIAPLEALHGKQHVHLARIKNARTKIIERVFADMAGNFDKTLPGYTGRHVMDRPEIWTIERQRGAFLSEQEIQQLVWDWMFNVYNNWKPGGRKSANEQWHEYFAKHPKRIPDEARLRHALLPIRRAPKGNGAYKVLPNGINIDNVWYWDEWLQRLPRNSMVFVRCEPNYQPERIWLYDENGNPLGELPRNRFHGYDYLEENPEKVTDFFKTRGDREKEIIQFKKQLAEEHGLELTPEMQQQRADIGREPVNVDFETGELLEPNPEKMPLDNIKLPKTVEELQEELREAQEQNKLLMNRLDHVSKSKKADHKKDINDIFNSLEANG